MREVNVGKVDMKNDLLLKQTSSRRLIWPGIFIRIFQHFMSHSSATMRKY